MSWRGIPSNIAPGGGTFTGTDGTTLQIYNASYVLQSGTNSNLVIATNQLKVSAATFTEYGIHVNPGGANVGYQLAFPVKQAGNHTQGTWMSAYSGTTPGSTSTDRDGYQVERDPGTTADDIFIQKVIDGSPVGTAVHLTTLALPDGDELAIQIFTSGSNRVIEVYQVSGGVAGGSPIVSATDDGANSFSGAVAVISTVQSFGLGMTDAAGGPGRVDSLQLGLLGTPGKAPPPCRGSRFPTALLIR